MSLTAKDVAEISKLLDESDFDELHLELDGVKISLRRSGAAAPARDVAPSFSAAGAAPVRASAPAAAPAPPSQSAPRAVDPSLHEVTAPLLGTFYRSPKPGAPPFIEVGSEVMPETVVCIIEVMKLMNTVRAGVRGRVAEVVAGDGALVEYGQALLRVSPSR